MKYTKFNLNKQKELTNNGEPHIHDTFQIHNNPIGETTLCNECNFPVDKEGDVVIENATAKLDHPYNQRFWVKTDYEIRPFLYFFTRKVKVGEQNIPTLLCNTCGLPQENHYI